MFSWQEPDISSLHCLHAVPNEVVLQHDVLGSVVEYMILSDRDGRLVVDLEHHLLSQPDPCQAVVAVAMYFDSQLERSTSFIVWDRQVNGMLPRNKKICQIYSFVSRHPYPSHCCCSRLGVVPMSLCHTCTWVAESHGVDYVAKDALHDREVLLLHEAQHESDCKGQIWSGVHQVPRPSMMRVLDDIICLPTSQNKGSTNRN
jgi:hypothetical protein